MILELGLPDEDRISLLRRYAALRTHDIRIDFDGANAVIDRVKRLQA